jgi:hypothetical protein
VVKRRSCPCAYTPRHSDVWGVELNINRLLTSTLVWDECSTSRSCQFTVGINWIGGWVGPSAGLGLDIVEKWGRNLHSCQEMSRDRPARRQSPNNFKCSVLSNYPTKKATNKQTNGHHISVSTKLMLWSTFIVRGSLHNAKIYPGIVSWRPETFVRICKNIISKNLS